MLVLLPPGSVQGGLDSKLQIDLKMFFQVKMNWSLWIWLIGNQLVSIAYVNKCDCYVVFFLPQELRKGLKKKVMEYYNHDLIVWLILETELGDGNNEIMINFRIKIIISDLVIMFSEMNGQWGSYQLENLPWLPKNYSNQHKLWFMKNDIGIWIFLPHSVNNFWF